MARLNLENSLFIEQGWLELVIAIRDSEKALGALVKAWIVAQKYWKDSDNGIPKSEWKKQKLNDALIGTMATENGDFILMDGSAKHFGWIRERIQAGKIGGIESGKARAEIIEEKFKQTEANPSKTKQNEPSYSYSSSFSEYKKKQNPKNLLPTGNPEKSDQIREAFGIWNQTLSKFGIPPSSMALPQETSIARAIKILGFENVCLALEGQRFEKPNDSFDPRRHLSIDRALHRDSKGKARWEEFKNMAAAERSKRAVSRAPLAVVEKTDLHLADGPEPTPEQVAEAKALVAGFLGSVGKKIGAEA